MTPEQLLTAASSLKLPPPVEDDEEAEVEEEEEEEEGKSSKGSGNYGRESSSPDKAVTDAGTIKLVIYCRFCSISQGKVKMRLKMSVKKVQYCGSSFKLLYC